MTAGGDAPPPGGSRSPVEWRFRGDPRAIRGRDAADVVATLRLRCAAGFPPAVASGPLAPFCAALAAVCGAPPVDPGLPDLPAAEALLVALASVGEAAPVIPGSLRLA